MPNVRLDTIKNQNTEIYSDWYLNIQYNKLILMNQF